MWRSVKVFVQDFVKVFVRVFVKVHMSQIKATKYTNYTKITKCELWNLYKIHIRLFGNTFFKVFVASNFSKTFWFVEMYVGVFDVFCTIN